MNQLQEKSEHTAEVSYRYLPDRADIDSWATRLGALAVLSLFSVGEGEYGSLYQALIFWSGIILAIFAIFSMAKQIFIYLTHKYPIRMQLVSKAICCEFSVVFSAAKLHSFMHSQSSMY